MCLRPEKLGSLISGETGLVFEAQTGIDSEGQRWYLLHPHGLPLDQTFAIRTTLGWRRLRINFEPGKFAGELLADMGRTDQIGRAGFRSILKDCVTKGAQIDLRINGDSIPIDGNGIWADGWHRFELSMTKGQLELGTEDGEPDAEIVCRWSGRFAAAVVALLPLEAESDDLLGHVSGYPEGAIKSVRVNRYERDRRNRAAAIAIHGASCAACGLNMSQRYGQVAAGYIEIHHVTPASQLGADYVIQPEHDLVPLCPNCHSISHRRVPPYSVREIRMFLASLEDLV